MSTTTSTYLTIESHADRIAFHAREQGYMQCIVEVTERLKQLADCNDCRMTMNDILGRVDARQDQVRRREGGSG